MAVIHRSKSVSIRSSKASFNRFLKPGALARFRDSRINTSKSVIKSDQISACCAGSMSGEIGELQIDERFLFTMRFFGPKVLKRKKLGARKSVVAAAATSDIAAH